MILKYTFTKLSDPGFELASTDINLILKTLEDCVCDICKMTKAQAEDMVNEEFYINRKHENWTFEEYEQALDEAMSEALPNNFEELPANEKVDYLLLTQCGDEYMLEYGCSEGLFNEMLGCV